MKFEWDETKRRTNLAKHGLDFAEAESVFHGVAFSFEDDRFEYGEHRFITIGLLGNTVVVMAHTEQEDVIVSFPCEGQPATSSVSTTGPLPRDGVRNNQ